ncbi:small acid-soluble spore protein SspI [Texcoconibacillus texcoconensis]|uniref:Small, acid-soluble spore protein I n=1 Tax=Texcoconibacillus texcoconensis TaxID=1095777 RepID=A0A840QMX4_9BACI|nr:small acid-soluble spore protein SspI [Texcoconibacillus texcoconensis]MBB5172693.1 small acid-soluble spore protein I (minor) [Texcoconibacillus texcoconensis]
MSFQLRGAIMQNISGSSAEEVEATIDDALQSGEEKMLPGLGVMFEVYWQQASDQDKEQMIQTISNGLQQQG